MEYSQTVNLPKTDFSMKAGLVQKEPEYLKRWEKIGIYKKQLEVRADSPSFIIHDGPPYANGEIHVGTALNKTVKDIINKYKFFRGFKVPYVPGWDCHGLPIELKVVEKLGDKAEKIPAHALRRECRTYAEKFVKIQMESFKRLGVFADWENPYLTMSEEYEAAIIESFGKLVERNYIYRGMRPVHWCIQDNTSLAEAEIEYHDHTSPAIYVKFPVVKHGVAKLQGQKVFVLIWTTTPWTLPANTGLSFHPEEHYVAVKIQGEYLIMAKELMDSVLSIRKIKGEEEIPLTRADIEKMTVHHCWLERESRPVFGMHVTMDTGTGVVHTAPGHGMEDYLMGIENKLPLLSPVDDKGRFMKDVEFFAGMNVFEANEKIIEFLDQRGALYFRQNISHSYPHCWRCKKPIIFRSKPQWFFRVSDGKLSDAALAELPKARWIPEWGQLRIQNMLEGRPDWCLSRQRNWGVPIPAFYCTDCDEAILTKESIDHIHGIVKAEGIDVWYKKEASELVKPGTKCPKCGSANFKKETDILDVWFDSGVSSMAVLDKRPGLSSPADVYLEGNDQYRGWFQASLWPSVAVKGQAPFKTVITHGWTLDEQGRQMHKSLGNAISPKEIWDKYGADVLRLCYVTEDYRGDFRIGENIIGKAVDSYRKLRNTFRYLMGNLDGFTQAQALKYNDLMDVDKYALALTFKLRESVVKYNDNFEFYRSFRETFNFCAVDMSAFYLDLLKDRLYIYPKDSRERLSAQTAMHAILEQLMLMLAPILPFTMEEVFLNYFSKNENESVHLLKWNDLPKEWDNQAVFQKYTDLVKVRDVVLKAVESLRSAKENPIGSSLEAKVTVRPLNKYYSDILKDQADYLRYLFIVSGVTLTDGPVQVAAADENVEVQAERTDGKKCARCWNYSTQVGAHEDHPELCERCYPVVKSILKA